MSDFSNPEPASDEQRIAENLRAAVKASGLSQRDIAERVGMDPTALSKVLSGARRVTSRELALICTATRTDVFTVLGTDPFHGPSYRRGYTEARLNLRRALERGESIESVLYRHADVRDGDYTACGAEKDGRYCDLPPHAWPQNHHADVYWEAALSTDHTDEKEKAMNGAELIAAERQRQIEAEGWTLAHDREHFGAELEDAALCYLTRDDERTFAGTVIGNGDGFTQIPDRWPWAARFWKPTPDDRVRELVKAGALIAAEIDRLASRG